MQRVHTNVTSLVTVRSSHVRHGQAPRTHEARHNTTPEKAENESIVVHTAASLCDGADDRAGEPEGRTPGGRLGEEAQRAGEADQGDPVCPRPWGRHRDGGKARVLFGDDSGRRPDAWRGVRRPQLRRPDRPPPHGGVQAHALCAGVRAAAVPPEPGAEARGVRLRRFDGPPPPQASARASVVSEPC